MMDSCNTSWFDDVTDLTNQKLEGHSCLQLMIEI